MHPAQRVLPDGELSGIIAQHHRVTQKAVRVLKPPLILPPLT